MKPDPARIRKAREEALRNRLVSVDGLLREQADRWISAWAEGSGEPQSASRSLG